LWSLLRHRRLGGHKFRRQYPAGTYIADFACFEKMLIVEADGGQHADSLNDERRTNWLKSQGWRVIRFWNDEILRNPQGITATILQNLAEG
jgi:very-short-patch-repair endonuclease